MSVTLPVLPQKSWPKLKIPPSDATVWYPRNEAAGPFEEPQDETALSRSRIHHRISVSRLRPFGSQHPLLSREFGDGKRTFQAGLGASGGKTEAHFDGSGRPVNSAALAAVSIVMQAAKAGGVEVAVSTRGVELSKTLEVRWANFEGRVFGFQDS